MMLDTLVVALFHIAWMLPCFAALTYVTKRVMSGARPATLHHLWLSVLPITLVASLAATFLHPPDMTDARFTSKPVSTMPSAPNNHLSVPLQEVLQLTRRSVDWILIFVCLTTCWMAVRLLLQLFSIRRLRRLAVPVSLSEQQHQLLQEIASRLNLKTPLILQSDAIQSPLILSAGRPAILLPPGFCESIPPDTFQAAMAHECSHIRRHDYAVNLALRSFAVFFAWHPCTIFVLRAAAASREVACDRLAAETMGSTQDYATSLLTLWQQLARTVPPPQGIGIFDANVLEERIMNITRDPRRLSVTRLAIISAITVVFVGLTTYAANALRVQVQEPTASVPLTGTPAESKTRMLIKAGDPVWPGNKSDTPGIFGNSVFVSFTVDSEGVPHKLRILRSGGDSFDQSALEAVQKWRFKPGEEMELHAEVHFNKY